VGISRELHGDRLRESEPSPTLSSQNSFEEEAAALLCQYLRPVRAGEVVVGLGCSGPGQDGSALATSCLWASVGPATLQQLQTSAWNTLETHLPIPVQRMEGLGAQFSQATYQTYASGKQLGNELVCVGGEWGERLGF
jgi:hypothetical protein